VRLQSNISNALVNFSSHTVSILAIVTDGIIGGRPAIGLAFNSIGRYAQSGIINNRMISRLTSAHPESLLQECGRLLSPEKVLACSLQNEKPGGHGDRAQAASALELAVWDLNAKLNDEPVSMTIARHFGRADRATRVSVYAAGGYYYEGASAPRLADEISGYQARGFDRFKIKIGGAPMDADMRRIEAAIRVAGAGSKLAVDANGRFGLEQALEYGRAIAGYGLMWYEEAGDPLDFELNSILASEYKGALATGENLFSHQDVKNLALFGGMRRGLDIFQMDPGLSYGITEYARMLGEMEARGFDRNQAFPHSGQLIGLHVVAGLGLGGCEVYPDVFQPMGGFTDDALVEHGSVRVPDAPGFGFERKSILINEFSKLFG
jgi:L-alanine-DL-glutamate epimerase-like enolase superfamily enzyme